MDDTNEGGRSEEKAYAQISRNLLGPRVSRRELVRRRGFWRMCAIADGP